MDIGQKWACKANMEAWMVNVLSLFPGFVVYAFEVRREPFAEGVATA